MKETNTMEGLVENLRQLPHLPENIKRLVDEIDANNRQIREF